MFSKASIIGIARLISSPQQEIPNVKVEVREGYEMTAYEGASNTLKEFQ